MEKSLNDINEENQDILRFFIWAVWNLFNSSTREEPQVGTPYLFDQFKHEDYTGVIGVNGLHKGAIFLTMDKNMITELLVNHHAEYLSEDLGEEELEELRIDYIGEMANIVAGNVRNYLGENFLISVPVSMTAPGADIILSENASGIVFPINWAGYRCHLILGLEIDTLAPLPATN